MGTLNISPGLASNSGALGQVTDVYTEMFLPASAGKICQTPPKASPQETAGSQLQGPLKNDQSENIFQNGENTEQLDKEIHHSAPGLSTVSLLEQDVSLGWGGTGNSSLNAILDLSNLKIFCFYSLLLPRIANTFQFEGHI